MREAKGKQKGLGLRACELSVHAYLPAFFLVVVVCNFKHVSLSFLGRPCMKWENTKRAKSKNRRFWGLRGMGWDVMGKLGAQ